MHCGMCGGLLVLLGSLGRLIHYRCRDCGLVQSAAATDDEEELWAC